MTHDMSNSMAIRFNEHDDMMVATLTGALGAADAPALTEALSDHAFGENARLAIDISGLTALDSAGLSVLIHVVTRARMTGGRVVLVSPSTFVEGVLSVTRLDTWFDICDTLDEAAMRLRRA